MAITMSMAKVMQQTQKTNSTTLNNLVFIGKLKKNTYK